MRRFESLARLGVCVALFAGYGALLLLIGCGATGVSMLPPVISPVSTPPATATPDIPSDGPGVLPTDFAFEVPQGYHSRSASEIPYTFHNWTDADVLVVAIPSLYFIDGDCEATLVPFAERVGFCGTPDYFAPQSHSVRALDLSLYGELDAGTYRLEFDVVDENYEFVETISAEFKVA